MNSARVAGGVAPFPAHSSLPEAQSPVRQENFPVGSWEHWVLPQKRPPHEVGAERSLDCWGWREKPVVEREGTPALERTPGHIV